MDSRIHTDETLRKKAESANKLAGQNYIFDRKQSIEFYQESAQYYRKIERLEEDDYNKLAYIYCNLGSQQYNVDEFLSAITSYYLALEAKNSKKNLNEKDKDLMIDIYCHLCDAYVRVHEEKLATEMKERGFALYQTLEENKSGGKKLDRDIFFADYQKKINSNSLLRSPLYVLQHSVLNNFTNKLATDQTIDQLAQINLTQNDLPANSGSTKEKASITTMTATDYGQLAVSYIETTKSEKANNTDAVMLAYAEALQILNKIEKPSAVDLRLFSHIYCNQANLFHYAEKTLPAQEAYQKAIAALETIDDKSDKDLDNLVMLKRNLANNQAGTKMAARSAFDEMADLLAHLRLHKQSKDEKSDKAETFNTVEHLIDQFENIQLSQQLINYNEAPAQAKNLRANSIFPDPTKIKKRKRVYVTPEDFLQNINADYCGEESGRETFHPPSLS